MQKGARLRFENGFGLDLAVVEFPINLGALFEWERLNFRRRQFAGFEAGSQFAQDFGGLLESLFHSVEAEQTAFIVIKINQVETDARLRTRTDRHLPSTPGERGEAFLEHRAADEIEDDVGAFALRCVACAFR